MIICLHLYSLLSYQLFILFIKFGILSPHFYINYFFLYGQCLFIDNILFGIEEVRYISLNR